MRQRTPRQASSERERLARICTHWAILSAASRDAGIEPPPPPDSCYAGGNTARALVRRLPAALPLPNVLVAADLGLDAPDAAYIPRPVDKTAPCPVLPGTPARVECYAARILAGFDLWHPRDNNGDTDDTAPAAAAASNHHPRHHHRKKLSTP